MEMLLHIGGTVRKPGWTVLSIEPGPHVDIVADCTDISVVADQSCALVYASHVVEHLHPLKVAPTLAGFYRVLVPNGKLMISVPNLDILCRLFITPNLSIEDKISLVHMIYGGHYTDFDVHHFGYTAEILAGVLTSAGFSNIKAVPTLGMFDDTSNYAFKGTPISLNMTAQKLK